MKVKRKMERSELAQTFLLFICRHVSESAQENSFNRWSLKKLTRLRTTMKLWRVFPCYITNFSSLSSVLTLVHKSSQLRWVTRAKNRRQSLSLYPLSLFCPQSFFGANGTLCVCACLWSALWLSISVVAFVCLFTNKSSYCTFISRPS